jgi:PAS domain S-box-containing protein
MKTQAERLKFLEMLVRELPESVYWKDTQGRYLGCNENMVKMSGYATVEEVIGKTDYDMSWRVIAPKLIENDQLVITSGQEQVFQEIAEDAMGQYRIMHTRKVPLKDDEGKVIGLLGVSTDVAGLNIPDNPAVTDRDATGIKILLAQDNELIQKVMAFHFKSWGYNLIDIVVDGAAALQKALLKKYDLIYLGLDFPDIQGAALAEQIRENQHSLNKNTAIIALAAYVDARIEKECIEAGMNLVLSKPLSESDVKKMIAEFILPKSTGPLVVDWALWRKRCGNHEDLVQQAWDITMRLLPEFKEQSTSALQTNDYAKLKEVVHKCYGGLKYCGLPSLEAAAKALEEAGSAGRYDGLETLHQNFITQIDAALQLKKE